MLIKESNAIRVPLALIPRAHTTVLVTLITLGMVLAVKVSLVSTISSLKFGICQTRSK